MSRLRLVGLLCLAVYCVIMGALFDGPDVDVYGLSVPLWLLGFVVYVLGAVAGWAAGADKARAGS